MDYLPPNFYLAPRALDQSTTLVEDLWTGNLLELSDNGASALRSLHVSYISSLELIRDYLPSSEFCFKDRAIFFQVRGRQYRLTQVSEDGYLFFKSDLQEGDQWLTVTSTTDPLLTSYFSVYFVLFDYDQLSFRDSFNEDFPYYLSEPESQ